MKKYSARVAVCGYVEFDFNHKYGNESVSEQAKRIAKSLEDMTSDIYVKSTTFKMDDIVIRDETGEKAPSCYDCEYCVDKPGNTILCNHFLIEIAKPESDDDYCTKFEKKKGEE